MKTLYKMVIGTFIPVFIVTIFFFVFVFQLLDVFTNIVQYLTKDVSLLDIGRIAFYYTPKCIIYSLPIGLLFSITFTLGNFYMNNELIAVYGSGVSLYRLVIPFFLTGIILSFFMFFFEDRIAIPTFKTKNQIYKKVLDQPEPYSNNNVAVKSADNTVIYQANFYNDKVKTLSGVTVLERDEKQNLLKRIEADSADWNGTNWVLHSCRIFSWNSKKTMFDEEITADYNSPRLNEKPNVFQKVTRKIDEMDTTDAYEWITALKKAGRPFAEALSEFYKKFSFALTPLIVTMISCSIGGILKKNVLLLSLFLSICIVVVYYVAQMVTMILASYGYIPPLWGAFSGFVIFSGIGIALLKIART